MIPQVVPWWRDDHADQEGYGVLRRDWETGGVTTFVWDAVTIDD